MKCRMTCVSAAMLALVLSSWAQAVDFTVGFQCPTEQVFGNTGEVKSVTLYSILTAANNTTADGAQGWSTSIEVSGGTLDAITLKGVTVDTYYCEDDDADPGTPCIEHLSFIQDLGAPEVFTKIANKATYKDDANRKGAITAVVLRGQEKMVLQPNGTFTISKLTVSGTIPETGCNTVTLSYVDGFKSSVSQPVKNVITFGGASVPPAVTQCQIQFCKVEAPKPEFYLAVVPEGITPPATNAGDIVYEKEVLPGDQTVAAFVYLTSKNIEGTDGPQGWSLSIANEGCMTVDSVTLKGVTVDTFYCEDDDADPGTPCIERPHFTQDLGAPEVFTKIANKADGSSPSPINDPNQKGVISAVVLRGQEKMVLYPNATDHVLKIVYKITVVKDQTTNCKAFVLDGLKSSVSQPVKNVVTFGGGSNPPKSTQSLIIKLTGKEQITPKKDQFKRGDANDDGKFNIADAVTVVENVIPGHTPIAPKIVCIDAGDADANGRLEIGDAVYILQWQFRHGPQPAAPYPECGTTAASTEVTCPDGSIKQCTTAP